MSSSSGVILASKTYTAAVTNEKGEVQPLPASAKELVAHIHVSRRVSGSITAIVEHSFDKVNWFTLATFTAAIATVSAEFKVPTGPTGSFVRSSVTSVIGDFDAKIACFYNPSKN